MENRFRKRKQSPHSVKHAVIPHWVMVLFCYILPAVLVTALIVSGVWGNRRRVEAEALRRTNEDIYTQAYTELTESVYSMNIALSKLLVSEAPSTLALTLDDIWRESGTIAGLMGRIPQSHVDSLELNRFLIQVGDYARQLSSALVSGGELSADDRGQLMEVYTASEDVFSMISEKLHSGNIPLEAIKGDAFFLSENEDTELNARDGGPAEQGASSQDGANSRYPTLIYDGPFSESTERRVPRGLSGEPLDEAAALERAREYLDGVNAALEYEGVSEGRIPFHSFTGELSDGGSVQIAVTVQGGALLYLREQRGDSLGMQTDEASTGEEAAENGSAVPEEAELSELKAAGLSWLKSHGYPEMEATYAQYYGDSVLISFAAVETLDLTVCDAELGAFSSEDGDLSELLLKLRQSGREAAHRRVRAILYNDLVKLWIERGSGKIIGADAENYLFSHMKRNISGAVMSMEEAARRLSGNLEIQKTALALIPRPDQSERLCWEFTGSFAGAEYIVYLDAATCDEVQIFRLITNENGSLTL